MIKEKWIYWEPSPKVTQDYMITEFIYKPSGVYLIAKHKKENLKPIFKLDFIVGVELCRIIDERSLSDTICNVQNTNRDNFFFDKSFFIVENSKLIKWLEKESAGLMKCFELKHFVFFNGDDFIEVIAHDYPDISEVE